MEQVDPAKVARLLEAFLADYPTVEEAYGAANSLYNPAFSGVFDPEKMLSVAQMGVKALPTSGPTRNTYGYALINAGRYGDGLREFETYARLAPREPNPYDSMGEAYLLLGLPDKAVESYSRALSIDPTFDSRATDRRSGWRCSAGTKRRLRSTLSWRLKRRFCCRASDATAKRRRRYGGTAVR